MTVLVDSKLMFEEIAGEKKNQNLNVEIGYERLFTVLSINEIR